MSSITYYPNIPSATDNPSNSQSQIQTNFGAINQLIGVDHVQFANTGAGYHERVSFPVDGNQTVPTNAKSVLDTLTQGGGNYNGYQIPYFTSTNGSTPISVPMIPNITGNGSQGYYYFQGQVLTYFGSDHIAAFSNTYTLTFSVPFPTPHLIPTCLFSFGSSITGGFPSYVLTGITQNGSFQATSVTILINTTTTSGTIPVYWTCTGF